MHPHDTPNDPSLQEPNATKLKSCFDRAPDGRLICPYCRSFFADGIELYKHLADVHPKRVWRDEGVWIGPENDENYYGRLADERDDDSFSSSAIFRRGVVARELRERLPVNNLPFIEVFADMVRVKVPIDPPENKGGSRRGLVYGMSPKSVARLREEVAKVKDWDGVLFTTQTTHDPIAAMKGEEVSELVMGRKHHRAMKLEEMSVGRYWKTKSEAFYKRLQRKFPEMAELWKLEFQGRGEPHNHSFLFKVLPVKSEEHLPVIERATWRYFAGDPQFRATAKAFINKLENFHEVTTNEEWKLKAAQLLSLTQNWQTDFLSAFRIWYAWNWWEVMGCQSDAHLLFGTWIEPVENRDKAKAYITKYLGKLEKHREAIIDTVRDRYGDDEQAVQEELAQYGILHTGRVWGVRGDLDRKGFYRVYLSARAFEHLRWLLVQWCRMQGRDGWKSTGKFSFYLAEAELGFKVLGLGMRSDQRSTGPPLIEQLIGFAYDLAMLDNETALLSLVPRVAGSPVA